MHLFWSRSVVQKHPYNRTFGLVLTEGKGLASVGCLMHVEVMQYENQRTDRFITFNRAVDRFRLVRLVSAVLLTCMTLCVTVR